MFTGQRLDTTGLYYYGARYYDPTIGRFISPDTFTQWSSGLDVVSHALTVNAIPAGLGTVRAPQGNYPKITLQVPRNPQGFNRYSYVINNPLTYDDPYGWWTFFIGLNVFAGGGPGINATWGIAVDGHGNYAIVTTCGGGSVGGYSLSGGVQLQGTGADSVGQLQGLSSQTGGSGTLAAGPSLGGEAVIGLEGEKYVGANLNISAGVGTPEGHITFDHSEVEVKGNVRSLTNSIGQLFSGNSQQYYRVASPLAVPQYIGGGFFNWGTDPNGAMIISNRDPSTYTVSEWYGE